jgi:hypothetical protein
LACDKKKKETEYSLPSSSWAFVHKHEGLPSSQLQYLSTLNGLHFSSKWPYQSKQCLEHHSSAQSRCLVHFLAFAGVRLYLNSLFGNFSHFSLVSLSFGSFQFKQED